MSLLMNKGLSLALVVVGVALLIYGFQANDSLSSDVSRVFNDTPTDKAMYLMIGGAAALIIGLVGLGRGRLKF